MNSTNHSLLVYREDGHCRLVDLKSCPDADASARQCAEFAEVCERIAWDEEARVVVLFFDGEMTGPEPRSPADAPSCVELAAKIKQPVVAVIRGNAAGFGLELALACDIRIAAEDAHFGFPQIKEGRLPCNGGTQRLPRLVGLTRAMDMILTGRLMDADEARRAGLIHRAVRPGVLVSSAMELAADMATKSPLSLSYVKEALYGGRDLTLDQGIRMEQDLYLLLFSTSDRSEGIRAFREKRKPDFKGL